MCQILTCPQRPGASEHVDPLTFTGNRTRVYEVLRGDRALSLAMIRRLNERLRIPAEVLIRPARLSKRKQAA